MRQALNGKVLTGMRHRIRCPILSRICTDALFAGMVPTPSLAQCNKCAPDGTIKISIRPPNRYQREPHVYGSKIRLMPKYTAHSTSSTNNSPYVLY